MQWVLAAVPITRHLPKTVQCQTATLGIFTQKLRIECWEREKAVQKERRGLLLCVGRQSHHVEKADLFQGINLERK